MIPTIDKYKEFKDKLSAFNILPTAADQPALRRYVTYQAFLDMISPDAKRKLWDRKRKKIGLGQVKQSAALMQRDATGQIAQEQADPHHSSQDDHDSDMIGS